MKWIGQHIYDLISRFRSDVYLEDISTGTIASGGNLGLDSNNKIVKDDGDGVTDLHGAGVDGSNNQLLTDDGDGTVTSETYLTFANSSNLSRMEFLSNEDTGDKFQITTTTHGATTLATFDDDATAAHISIVPDGDIRLKPATGILRFMDSDNAADYTSLEVGLHGDIKLTTRDIAATAAHFEIAADGDITLDAAGDIALEAGGGDITVDTDNFVIESSTSQKPFLELKNTASGTKCSVLQFTKDKGEAGADGDYIGIISFVGDDAAQTQTSFASIVANVSEADDTDEAGKLTLSVANDGTLRNGITMEGSKATAAEVDVTIANGAASTTTIAGTLTMGSTATINNSGVIQVAAQTVIDHDQLANFAAGEHFTQANITTVGTIGTGVWNGTKVASAYLDDDTAHLSGSQTFTGTKTLNSFKGTGGATVTNILDEDAMGSDSATALATQQSIKAYVDAMPVKASFRFAGYGTADGTNYEIPEIMTDTNAPFEHNTSVGADGLTALAVSLLLRCAGQVMPYAGTLKNWIGWAASSGSGTTYVSLFKYTPNPSSSSAVSLVLLDEQSFTAAGNNTVLAISQTSFTDADVAVGDIIITGVKGVNNKTVYFTSTLEVEWD